MSGLYTRPSTRAYTAPRKKRRHRRPEPMIWPGNQRAASSKARTAKEYARSPKAVPWAGWRFRTWAGEARKICTTPAGSLTIGSQVSLCISMLRNTTSSCLSILILAINILFAWARRTATLTDRLPMPCHLHPRQLHLALPHTCRRSAQSHQPFFWPLRFSYFFKPYFVEF